MSDDCERILHELADFLHGEVTPEKRRALQEHLEECPPCLETADFQAQLRQLVAKRCGEEVPDELKAKVVAMLRVEVTHTAEFTDGGGAS
jgi:anti-sigma factor (TIGR02949 family)